MSIHSLDMPRGDLSHTRHLWHTCTTPSIACTHTCYHSAWLTKSGLCSSFCTRLTNLVLRLPNFTCPYACQRLHGTTSYSRSLHLTIIPLVSLPSLVFSSSVVKVSYDGHLYCTRRTTMDAGHASMLIETTASCEQIIHTYPHRSP